MVLEKEGCRVREREHCSSLGDCRSRVEMEGSVIGTFQCILPQKAVSNVAGEGVIECVMESFMAP